MSEHGSAASRRLRLTAPIEIVGWTSTKLLRKRIIDRENIPRTKSRIKKHFNSSRIRGFHLHGMLSVSTAEETINTSCYRSGYLKIHTLIHACTKRDWWYWETELTFVVSGRAFRTGSHDLLHLLVLGQLNNKMANISFKFTSISIFSNHTP